MERPVSLNFALSPCFSSACARPSARGDMLLGNEHITVGNHSSPVRQHANETRIAQP